MRSILVLLFSLLFVFANAQQRTARCVFTSYSSLSGTVWLTYDGTAKTTMFNVSVNAGTTLPDDNNSLHIHQVGLDSSSTSCNDTLKHYNPILNYGELTGVNGNIAKNGTKVFTSTTVSLEGPYNILGRSLVFHNSSGYRLGCCIIELTSDTLTAPAAGYNASRLYVSTPLASYTIQNVQSQTTFNATITIGSPLINGTTYVSHVHTLGYCDTGAYGSVLLPLPTLSNLSVNSNLTFEADINKYAGRAFVTHNNADLNLILSCGIVAQKEYQPNVADTYQAPTPTPSPTPTPNSPTPNPSGSAVVLGFSVLALIANLF